MKKSFDAKFQLEKKDLSQETKKVISEKEHEIETEFK